jgi:hypothetical protein
MDVTLQSSQRNEPITWIESAEIIIGNTSYSLDFNNGIYEVTVPTPSNEVTIQVQYKPQYDVAFAKLGFRVEYDQHVIPLQLMKIIPL